MLRKTLIALAVLMVMGCTMDVNEYGVTREIYVDNYATRDDARRALVAQGFVLCASFGYDPDKTKTLRATFWHRKRSHHNGLGVFLCKKVIGVCYGS